MLASFGREQIGTTTSNAKVMAPAVIKTAKRAKRHAGPIGRSEDECPKRSQFLADRAAARAQTQ